MRRTVSVLGGCVVVVAVVVGLADRRSAAQDGGAPSGGAAGAVDKLMASVGGGQLDDAAAFMDRLKTPTAVRDGARDALLKLRELQLGDYHGYDVATTVRSSPRFETVDVLAYYDQQPVLIRIDFYHPQADDAVPWTILDFRVDPNLTTAVEVLREDAPGLAVGRGGRATR